LIFWCHDGNPRGSNQRPRRTWARVLWFSPTPRPYVDLKALRTPAQPKRGTIKDPRFQWQREKQVTTTRITDLLVGTNGSMKKHVDHPAKFPADLPRVLIQTFSRKNGIILDPFVGSGTTCIVARELGRRWIGIDCERAYVRLANRSIPK
jgi:DNA modification methylase